MIHNVEAIYDHGVLRPVEPLILPEGTRVQICVEAEHPAVEESNGTADYETWLAGLAGRWQGDFVRGDEGNFERREPLS